MPQGEDFNLCRQKGGALYSLLLGVPSRSARAAGGRRAAGYRSGARGTRCPTGVPLGSGTPPSACLTHCSSNTSIVIGIRKLQWRTDAPKAHQGKVHRWTLSTKNQCGTARLPLPLALFFGTPHGALFGAARAHSRSPAACACGIPLPPVLTTAASLSHHAAYTQWHKDVSAFREERGKIYSCLF